MSIILKIDYCYSLLFYHCFIVVILLDIRTSNVHPHLKKIKKFDPVNRYDMGND